jgi:hypothetical protein
MEKTTSSEALRLLTSAHTISWSSSAGSNDASFLEHPLERAVPRRTGYIESKIHRDGGQYVMYLQAPDKNHPIFVAEKQRGKFVLRNGNGGIIGSLSKTSTKGSKIVYSLFRHDGSKTSSKEVASIQYEVPSVLQALTDGPPRRAKVVVAGKVSVETKEPYSKDGGKRGLDFRGRGREPSRKNMQLQDRDGKVVLQMAKWDKDDFHIDFA